MPVPFLYHGCFPGGPFASKLFWCQKTIVILIEFFEFGISRFANYVFADIGLYSAIAVEQFDCGNEFGAPRNL